MQILSKNKTTNLVIHNLLHKLCHETAISNKHQSPVNCGILYYLVIGEIIKIISIKYIE